MASTPLISRLLLDLADFVLQHRNLRLFRLHVFAAGKGVSPIPLIMLEPPSQQILVQIPVPYHLRYRNPGCRAKRTASSLISPVNFRQVIGRLQLHHLTRCRYL
jgi:hypothetical protein